MYNDSINHSLASEIKEDCLSREEPTEAELAAFDSLRSETKDNVLPVSFTHLKNFKILRKLDNSNLAIQFKHNVYVTDFNNPIRQEEKKKSSFYLKVIDDDYRPDYNQIYALLEVIGQEFIRMLDPTQPMTKLVTDANRQGYCVASEEVQGFVAFSQIPQKDTIKGHLLSGTYYGLGSKLISSWYLDEYDLNEGNLGVDKLGQVHKIDGGWYFGRLHANYKSHITPKDYQRFPFVTDFKPKYWLDTIAWYEVKKRWYRYPEIRRRVDQGKILSPELCTNPDFLEEMHYTTMQILLLPDSFLRRFVDQLFAMKSKLQVCDQATECQDNYFNLRKSQSYANYLINRKKELEFAAIQNPEFQQYLEDKRVACDKDTFINSLKVFKLSGQQNVFDIVDRLEDRINTKFKDLCAYANQVKANPNLLRRTDSQAPSPVNAPLVREVSSWQRWKSRFVGACATLLVGLVVTAVLLLFGALTVATIGANIGVTVIIAGLIALIGGIGGDYNSRPSLARATPRPTTSSNTTVPVQSNISPTLKKFYQQKPQTIPTQQQDANLKTASKEHEKAIKKLDQLTQEIISENQQQEESVQSTKKTLILPDGKNIRSDNVKTDFMSPFENEALHLVRPVN